MTSPAVAGSPPGEDFLADVERETRRFVEVAARSPLPAHVPAYPAFAVETLSAHIGRTLRTFHTIVSAGSYPADGVVTAPQGSDVIEWVEAGLRPLITVLGDVSPDKLVTFPHGVGDRPASAVGPLLAVEVGVHRWDVETVLGDHAPIPASLAIEEVDKVLENYVPRLAGSGVAPIGGTVELRATDADVRWGLAVRDGRLAAGRLGAADEDADVVVSASSQELALLVWKRSAPHPDLDVRGPVDVLKRLLSVDYIPDPRTTREH